MASYALLRDYLNNQRAAELVLTLDEIEGILGEPLPPTARKRPQYWENAEKPEHRPPPNRAAREAGYTAFLMPQEQKVRFVRE